jgi:hypothetical protein
MCQHGCLRVAGAAAGKLEVCNIVGAYYCVEDIEDVIGNGLRFLPEVSGIRSSGLVTSMEGLPGLVFPVMVRCRSAQW